MTFTQGRGARELQIIARLMDLIPKRGGDSDMIDASAYCLDLFKRRCSDTWRWLDENNYPLEATASIVADSIFGRPFYNPREPQP